jgi:hypothetical protein
MPDATHLIGGALMAASLLLSLLLSLFLCAIIASCVAAKVVRRSRENAARRLVRGDGAVSHPELCRGSVFPPETSRN